jgi:DNA-nicking Smr family endonuclease
MLEVYEKERAEKRDAAAQAKEERKERKRRCMAARVDYENYYNTNRIYELQEDGSRKYLSEQQREQYLSKLKSKMDKYCK